MTQWIYLDEGHYNTVYRNFDCTLVFKVPKVHLDPTEDDYDIPERAMHLWKLINPKFKNTVYPHSDPDLGEGWVQPFFSFKQANDVEICGELLKIYMNTGRIVLDATCTNNMIRVKGKIICLDSSMAVEFGARYPSIIAQSGRRRSVISVQLWSLMRYCHTGSFNERALYFPCSIQLIKALIHLETCKTESSLTKQQLQSLISDKSPGKELRKLLASRYDNALNLPENKLADIFNHSQCLKRMALKKKMYDRPHNPLPTDTLISLSETIKENDFPRLATYSIEIKNELLPFAIATDHKLLVLALFNDETFSLHCYPDRFLLVMQKNWHDVLDKMLTKDLSLDTLRKILLLIINENYFACRFYIMPILRRYPQFKLSSWGVEISNAFLGSGEASPAECSTADIQFLFGLAINKNLVAVVTSMLDTLINRNQQQVASELLGHFEYQMTAYFKNDLFLKVISSKNEYCAHALLNTDTNLFKTSLGKKAYLKTNTLHEALLFIMKEPDGRLTPIATQIFTGYDPFYLQLWLLNDNDCFILHHAIISRKPIEIIQLLCEHSMSVITKNPEQKSALDLAIETGQYAVVRILLEHGRQRFTKGQILALGEMFIEIGELYLVVDLLFSQRDTLNPPKIPLQPTAPGLLLTWNQFECIFKLFENKITLTRLIQYQVSLIKPENFQLKNLIQRHAMACCNFLMDQKKDSGYGRHLLNDSMLYLKRILCENIPATREALQEELVVFVDGKKIYKHLVNAKPLHSRRSYAYDLGLFSQQNQLSQHCLEDTKVCGNW